MIPKHLIPNFDSNPNPESVILVDNLRVSVITSRLLRVEYSPENGFEDHPSQAFWYRNQPTPDFTFTNGAGSRHNQHPDTLVITTPDLILNYQIGKSPSPESLSIQVKSMNHTWRFGDENPGNLKGTYRTLDNRSGNVTLEQGLLSRDGWVLVDDSHSLVFNENGWLEPRRFQNRNLDLYFFGYGHEFQDCIRDFRAVAGPVPLLPRWVLGNWWSRYWNYNQDQVIELIEEFQYHEVPLSVMIIDMDWHITETGNESSGWTGYTWNRELFPNPPQLIRDIHERGLRTALNLHPAAGIYPHEEQYREFAKRMGIDPQSQEPIKFNLADPKFALAYFELLHHPQEGIGLDFWWIDWQQGILSALPGLDPLWWLNHLHFLDLSRPSPKDPTTPRHHSFIFSRWGGLGNHRYPIGFSGDTIVSWESLAFQPYFTATAANVCYGWWSHDIGGHMSGIEEPELYTRWVQYGLFSPIFRLHSTKNPFHERRPFAYDAEIARLTSHAMRLRHGFIPYLYTMAWRDHEDAVTPIRPLYYLEPQSEPAYYTPDAYTFGSELVAAPHTKPLGSETRLSRQKIWLPEGRWYNFFTGTEIPGGHHVIYGDLCDIPLYAKAGAIIPLSPLQNWGGVETPSHLRIHIFAGDENHFELYEDDGQTTNFQKNIFEITPLNLISTEDQLIFSIGPVKGEKAVPPKKRTFELKFWGIKDPDTYSLEINNKSCSTFPEYDLDSHSMIVPIDYEISPTDRIVFSMKKQGGVAFNWDTPIHQIVDCCANLINAFRLESYTKMGLFEEMPKIVRDPSLLSRTRPTLSDMQLLALLETITRSGFHRIQNHGDDHIILWNNNPIQDSFPVTYHLTVNQLHQGYFENPYYYEYGPIPLFKVFHPPSQFGDNPWELRVNYGEVLAVNLSSGD